MQAHAAHGGRVDDGERHAGEPFGEHDPARVGGEDRGLVRLARVALARGDEPRAALHTGVAHAQRVHEAGRIPHPAGAHDRKPERQELIQQRTRVARPAWPPARAFTATKPSTPPSSAFFAHFASVTSW
jgi:hypothetical protein